jgi:hypothetical protein
MRSPVETRCAGVADIGLTHIIPKSHRSERLMKAPAKVTG